MTYTSPRATPGHRNPAFNVQVLTKGGQSLFQMVGFSIKPSSFAKYGPKTKRKQCMFTVDRLYAYNEDLCLCFQSEEKLKVGIQMKTWCKPNKIFGSIISAQPKDKRNVSVTCKILKIPSSSVYTVLLPQNQRVEVFIDGSGTKAEKQH